jgi:hypothetical protein
MFADNTAAGGGGGAFGAAVITGTSFISNSATGLGGGGGAHFTGPAQVQNTTFNGNRASGDSGGGARFEAGSVLTGTTFTGNSTTGLGTHGGGAYFGEAAVITDTSFISNMAANGNGGGVYFYGAASTVTNTVVTGNQALCEEEQLARSAIVAQPTLDCGNGGGAYAASIAILDTGVDWDHPDISANVAERNGGGVYLSGPQLVGYDLATFRENIAGERGGAAYLNGSNFEISNAIISENEATTDGGGFFLTNSNVGLRNMILQRNRAIDNLGASDISMSFSGSTVVAKHVTNIGSPRIIGGIPTLGYKVGTRVPDEDGQQGQAATLVNMIFHGYDIGVQGQSPTSTITISGVLWSSVTTPVQLGIFNTQLEYTGAAAFVNELGGDYHLSADSDAIDRGVVTEVTTDFDGLARNQGSAPDLGAYEFQGSPPKNLAEIYLPITMKR